MSTITYAHGAISDKTYPVTSFRPGGSYHDAPNVSATGEYEVGGLDAWGHVIEAIDFYTGFAGCPARYYVTCMADGRRITTVSNA